MITKDTIKKLYKQFHHRPRSLQDRNLSLLVDYALDTDALDMDGEKIVFTRMDPMSPFREIELERVNGVADLPDFTAVVLANSIIFINKRNLSTTAHIRAERPSLWQWLRYHLSK